MFLAISTVSKNVSSSFSCSLIAFYGAFKRFLEDGLPPQMILKGYRKARRRVGERPTVRFSLLSVLPAAVSHLGVNPWANASGIAVSRAGRCEQFVVDSEGVSGCFDGF